jgi:hypothetical protein
MAKIKLTGLIIFPPSMPLFTGLLPCRITEAANVLIIFSPFDKFNTLLMRLSQQKGPGFSVCQGIEKHNICQAVVDGQEFLCY